MKYPDGQLLLHRHLCENIWSSYYLTGFGVAIPCFITHPCTSGVFISSGREHAGLIKDTDLNQKITWILEQDLNFQLIV